MWGDTCVSSTCFDTFICSWKTLNNSIILIKLQLFIPTRKKITLVYFKPKTKLYTVILQVFSVQKSIICEISQREEFFPTTAALLLLKSGIAGSLYSIVPVHM